MRTGSRFTLRPLAKVTIIAQLYIFLVSSCFAAFTLDSTFNGGKVTISFPNSSSNYSSQAFRVFVQPNCRVVLAGSFTNGTADGQLTGVAWVGLTTVGASWLPACGGSKDDGHPHDPSFDDACAFESVLQSLLDERGIGNKVAMHDTAHCNVPVSGLGMR